MAYVTPTAHIEAAIIASESPEMEDAADRVLASVRAVAAAHVRTGNYERNLKKITVRTKRGVKDRLIVADDEDAQLIEFGAVVEATGRVIPGLHIMREGLKNV